VFENRVLRKIFTLNMDEVVLQFRTPVFYNQEFCASYRSSSTIRIVRYNVGGYDVLVMIGRLL
jgi:hypothetical protein